MAATPPLRLEVADRYRPRSDRAFVARVVEAALDHTGRRDLAVSLLLTDESEIGRLHGEYLGDPSPTDVISFLLDESVEMAVSVERARREARARGHTIRAELALYIVHGILHACGYDDVASADRASMRAAERAVLDRLGQRIPSVDG